MRGRWRGSCCFLWKDCGTALSVTRLAYRNHVQRLRVVTMVVCDSRRIAVMATQRTNHREIAAHHCPANQFVSVFFLRIPQHHARTAINRMTMPHKLITATDAVLQRHVRGDVFSHHATPFSGAYMSSYVMPLTVDMILFAHRRDGTRSPNRHAFTVRGLPEIMAANVSSPVFSMYSGSLMRHITTRFVFGHKPRMQRFVYGHLFAIWANCRRHGLR